MINLFICSFVEYLMLSIIKKSNNISMNSRIYQVQTIIDEAVINYQPHYLIKWKDLPHQHDTWEPISSLKNVLEYLKYWIQEKKAKSLKNKEKSKAKNFKEIKPYLYGGQFLSKKSNKYQKYCEQILNKKKTWEKYLTNEDNYIQIQDNDTDYPVCKSIKRQDKSLDKRHTRLRKRSQKKNILKMQEEQQEIQKIDDNQNDFSVVGTVNVINIKRIIRAFLFNEVKCLQIEMNDGQLFNMKQEELTRVCPQMLVQFYKSENIEF